MWQEKHCKSAKLSWHHIKLSFCLFAFFVIFFVYLSFGLLSFCLDITLIKCLKSICNICNICDICNVCASDWQMMKGACNQTDTWIETGQLSTFSPFFPHTVFLKYGLEIHWSVDWSLRIQKRRLFSRWPYLSTVPAGIFSCMGGYGSTGVGRRAASTLGDVLTHIYETTSSSLSLIFSVYAHDHPWSSSCPTCTRVQSWKPWRP